jgi:hypothetical protein
MHVIDLHQLEQGAIKLMPSVASGGFGTPNPEENTL